MSADIGLSSTELCNITGLTDRRHRQLAGLGYFPPPIKGQYQPGKTLVGIIKYQREQLAKKDDTLRKEQIAHTKAKRELAQEELAIIRSQYVPLADLAPRLGNVATNQRIVLQRIFEQEVGPNLSGLTTPEIMERMKRGVDETCAVFREGTGQWMNQVKAT